jgi:peptidoglycan/LPS O-acetylase OafA/YrhL
MQPTDRLHSLDAVRASALLLGIFLHATMPFLQGLVGWVATDTPSATLAAVFYFIHMFRMPVFFFIAGFFGRMVLERKGTKAFIRDRSKRILVPLVVGLPVVLLLTGVAFVLGALAAGVDLMAYAAEQQAAAQAAAQEQAAQQGGGGGGVSLAHLWFLYYLAIFYAGVLVIRGAFDKVLDRGGKVRLALDAIVRFIMRGVWGPVLLALPIAAYFYNYDGWPGWNGLPAPFSTYPQAGALIGYGIIFGFGWLLHRQAHLLLALERTWPLYCGLAVVLAVLCYRIAGPVPQWQPYLEGRELLIYTPAYMVAMWCWVFGIVGAAVRFLSSPSAARRYIADSSYWLYLMHVPVLAFFHVWFAELDWHWSAKYLLSIAGAMPILLLSYHYWVRFTFIGATLNGRRYPRVRAEQASAPAVS